MEPGEEQKLKAVVMVLEKKKWLSQSGAPVAYVGQRGCIAIARC